MSTLVVYFSRKGYAKKLALAEAMRMGADVMELKSAERTSGILGFWWCGRFGMHRWGMPLLELSRDAAAYDEVVLVSPIWVFGVCAPMREYADKIAGKVKSARYIFVHFSFPMNYDGARRYLDDKLGVKSTRYESVCCMWGHIFGRRTF